MSATNGSKRARNVEWVRRFLSGATLREIAADAGVTRQRVGQVVRAYGVPRSVGLARTGRPRSNRVAWQCAVCGKREQRTEARAARPTCSRACGGVYRRTGPDLTDGRAVHRASDGHLWTTCQFTGHAIRAERYLMQKHLGRPLDRSEWVTLKDGDPDNLTLDNIEIRDPSWVARNRARAVYEWDRVMVMNALWGWVDQHGDLPTSKDAASSDRLPAVATIMRHLDVESWPVGMAIADEELGVGGRYADDDPPPDAA